MANIEPINNQPLSDDQELAKVLAGVSQQADETTTNGGATDVSLPATPPLPQDDSAATPSPEDDTTAPADDTSLASDVESPSISTVPPKSTDVETSTLPPAADTPLSIPTPSLSSMPVSGGSELDGIKQEALGELRPLVDKLNVAPEEKFDTYLLLLRSTDDKALIAPAHDAAKNIPDETRRAQALLDIIKEIDFLTQSGQ
ncbi:bifunctional phosphoglucose/phosphomannose isomerase [Candidatus Saccharibacteria bacterium RAAC3_TM7_1]|nr:bifunctional phosphoglucose/phosphomannose isomerase [Candidatus Saccharibacteria bacterium RAAC3_TM7_1]